MRTHASLSFKARRTRLSGPPIGLAGSAAEEAAGRTAVPIGAAKLLCDPPAHAARTLLFQFVKTVCVRIRIKERSIGRALCSVRLVHAEE